MSSGSLKSVLEVAVDPYLQARRARHIQGSIAIAKFERLVGTLSPKSLSAVSSTEQTTQKHGGTQLQTNTDVEVDVEFSRSVRGQPQFQLTVKATLFAECQRCLGEVSYCINSEKTMLVLNDEAALENASKKFGEEFEFVLAKEEKLILMPIIEDELLLSLPLMFKHDDCQMAVESVDDDEKLEKRVNPFAVLSQLKE
ncbi:MAG: DUF177 domain-containing protein [Gammaproteobacteria bacterium]|nr:DUF177 domain-containing protein [Gammaproteobacteria bacterium]